MASTLTHLQICNCLEYQHKINWNVEDTCGYSKWFGLQIEYVGIISGNLCLRKCAQPNCSLRHSGVSRDKHKCNPDPWIISSIVFESRCCFNFNPPPMLRSENSTFCKLYLFNFVCVFTFFLILSQILGLNGCFCSIIRQCCCNGTDVVICSVNFVTLANGGSC